MKSSALMVIGLIAAIFLAYKASEMAHTAMALKDQQQSSTNAALTGLTGEKTSDGHFTCPTDARACPDGSPIFRTGPSCVFGPCITMTCVLNTDCTDALRKNCVHDKGQPSGICKVSATEG